MAMLKVSNVWFINRVRQSEFKVNQLKFKLQEKKSGSPILLLLLHMLSWGELSINPYA